MAEEAFALSPISARASLPSEADYDAIREAFMETSRGRWFLSEYTKRNRNADTSMVLDAVARIEQNLAAQKQAPTNELIESLGAIRAIVGEARASVAQAIAGLASGETLSAAHDGARIIREIAWTLRDCGADTRICDLLDAQIGAIDSGHRQIAAVSTEAILATFDQVMRRIADLADADADTTPADEAKPSDVEHAAAPIAEGQSSAAVVSETVAETTSAISPDHAETGMQVDGPVAIADLSVAELSVAEVHIETALETEPAAQSEIAPHSETAPAVAFESQAKTAAHLETEMEPPETATHVEIEPLAKAAAQIGFEPHADAVAHAEAALAAEKAAYGEPAAPQSIASEIERLDQPALLDRETAHEAAVLDLVALEMAADDVSKEAVADLPHVEPAHVEPAHIESAYVEAVDLEPVIAAPVDLEPRVSFETIAAAESSLAGEASAPLPPPSLGAALIASGAVPKPVAPGIDPLAPIRRMTQIEKIAFFS
jgi:hypothetical protein